MKNNLNILHKILLARDRRELRQKELIKRYGCSLISFTLNIPGLIKDTPLYREVHKEGMKEILRRINGKQIDAIYKEVSYKDTGAEAFVVVDLEGLELKKITVDIEESHSLGRIFDIDVINKDFKSISREEIGFEQRKCLLCDEKALICKRKKTHTNDDLIEEINRLALKYFK
ncbi:MAG: holo-ACP synthase [Candidatus Petromonas sp.]|jgi:holo-ACP synthase|nr:holo-ACP synthase [Candidatus Petromonas sp.]